MKIDYENVQIISAIPLVSKSYRDYTLNIGLIPDLDMFIVWEDKGRLLGETAIYSDKEEAKKKEEEFKYCNGCPCRKGGSLRCPGFRRLIGSCACCGSAYSRQTAGSSQTAACLYDPYKEGLQAVS